MHFDFDKVTTNIQKLRHDRGFNQEYVGSKLGISATSYGRLESGSIDIKLNHIDKLAEIFGVTNVEILEPDAKKTCSELKLLSESTKDLIISLKKQLIDKEEIIQLLKEKEGFKKKYHDQ
jgi:transcriptional regulator with XRE-family HTH domain